MLDCLLSKEGNKVRFFERGNKKVTEGVSIITDK